MKTCLEFGIRGGFHTDNVVLPSIKIGIKLAYSIAKSMGADGVTPRDFDVCRHTPRMTWQSSTHFVSLSLLDGIMRGPASSELWKV